MINLFVGSTKDTVKFDCGFADLHLATTAFTGPRSSVWQQQSCHCQEWSRFSLLAPVQQVTYKFGWRCKNRSLTMEGGAVRRRLAEPSNLSRAILTLEVEVLPLSCKDGENWRTGSSDIDFKTSVSCLILIPGATFLHILLSKYNFMQTWNNDCYNTNSSRFSRDSTFIWLKKWEPQKGVITIQSRLYLKTVLLKTFPSWIYLLSSLGFSYNINFVNVHH